MLLKALSNKVWKIMLSGLLTLGLAACGNSSEPKVQIVHSGPAQSSKASSYPEKPITMIAPSGPGGGWDRTARVTAKVLTETKLISKSMTVENKPGGGGVVFLADYATKDKKNNYKLFISSPPILLNHLKREGNSPFGYRDTTPLAQLIKDYGAIVVNADSKFKDLKSLIDVLKADPSQVTFAGGSAPGSMYHMVSVLPALKSGIDAKKIKYVSYDGTGESMTALLGGHADVLSTDASSLGDYLKAGKIRVLAVASPSRLGGELKDAPTMKEQGVDAEFNIWRGVFGPKEMGKDAFDYWEAKLKEMVQSEAWQRELKANNWEGDYKNPADFKAFLEKQEAQIKELLTAIGMEK
ncbi:Bug family tripartite tricarboxylate transporter substrate binding protein [Paenibacillus naphthalenovorans]|uniref:Bug family tripartite tricarboxylate transporter substrate binding protein n=1 Tax=Paenibacillus naphthalenovorans TaxID=162209 RepID=UPI003D2C7CA8